MPKFKVGDPVIYTDGKTGVSYLEIKGDLRDGTYWVGSTLDNATGLNLRLFEKDLVLDRNRIKNK